MTASTPENHRAVTHDEARRLAAMTRMLPRGRPSERWSDPRGGLLAQPPPHPAPLRQQLCLELVQLLTPSPHEPELEVDVADRLLEDLPAAHRVLDAGVPFAGAGRSGGLFR